ncbi:MAG: PA2779 family protein [Desulfobacterales bacterium]|jgi:hypothetical protein|nr:PA2779 family protein [Desulfobacterales bacterium]
MKRIFRIVRPLSIVLAAWVFLISGPLQAGAALVGTESVVDAAGVQSAREAVRELMAREEIQAALARQGIDPAEAQARAEALSDAEAVRLANVMESLPAGGSSLGIVVGAILIVFIILLITDILGYTDIFPFTKKHR